MVLKSGVYRVGDKTYKINRSKMSSSKLRRVEREYRRELARARNEVVKQQNLRDAREKAAREAREARRDASGYYQKRAAKEKEQSERRARWEAEKAIKRERQKQLKYKQVYATKGKEAAEEYQESLSEPDTIGDAITREQKRLEKKYGEDYAKDTRFSKEEIAFRQVVKPAEPDPLPTEKDVYPAYTGPRPSKGDPFGTKGALKEDPTYTERNIADRVNYAQGYSGDPGRVKMQEAFNRGYTGYMTFATPEGAKYDSGYGYGGGMAGELKPDSAVRIGAKRLFRKAQYKRERETSGVEYVDVGNIGELVKRGDLSLEQAKKIQTGVSLDVREGERIIPESVEFGEEGITYNVEEVKPYKIKYAGYGGEAKTYSFKTQKELNAFLSDVREGDSKALRESGYYSYQNKLTEQIKKDRVLSPIMGGYIDKEPITTPPQNKVKPDVVAMGLVPEVKENTGRIPTEYFIFGGALTEGLGYAAPKAFSISKYGFTARGVKDYVKGTPKLYKGVGATGTALLSKGGVYAIGKGLVKGTAGAIGYVVGQKIAEPVVKTYTSGVRKVGDYLEPHIGSGRAQLIEQQQLPIVGPALASVQEGVWSMGLRYYGVSEAEIRQLNSAQQKRLVSKGGALETAAVQVGKEAVGFATAGAAMTAADKAITGVEKASLIGKQVLKGGEGRLHRPFEAERFGRAGTEIYYQKAKVTPQGDVHLVKDVQLNLKNVKAPKINLDKIIKPTKTPVQTVYKSPVTGSYMTPREQFTQPLSKAYSGVQTGVARGVRAVTPLAQKTALTIRRTPSIIKTQTGALTKFVKTPIKDLALFRGDIVAAYGGGIVQYQPKPQPPAIVRKEVAIPKPSSPTVIDTGIVGGGDITFPRPSQPTYQPPSPPQPYKKPPSEKRIVPKEPKPKKIIRDDRRDVKGWQLTVPTPVPPPPLIPIPFFGVGDGALGLGRRRFRVKKTFVNPLASAKEALALATGFKSKKKKKNKKRVGVSGLVQI
jgi:hypothetical protein